MEVLIFIYKGPKQLLSLQNGSRLDSPFFKSSHSCWVVGLVLPYPSDNLVLDVVLMLLFLGLETLRIFYGETDLRVESEAVSALGFPAFQWRRPLTGRSAGPRLEGEPVRALSGVLPLALHPGPVRGARRLRAAAADLRPEDGVHPGRRPAALLRAGAGAGAGVAVGLLKVNVG